MAQAQQKQLAALFAIRDLMAQMSADELERMDVLAEEKRSPRLMKQWVAVSQAFRRWWSSGAMLWPQHERV